MFPLCTNWNEGLTTEGIETKRNRQGGISLQTVLTRFQIDYDYFDQFISLIISEIASQKVKISSTAKPVISLR